MWFVYFNLIVAVITFALFELTSYEHFHRFKTRYPDLTVPKMTFAGKLATHIKTAVASLVPIVNLVLLWALVFESSKIEEKTMQQLYEKCMRYKENENAVSD